MNSGRVASTVRSLLSDGMVASIDATTSKVMDRWQASSRRQLEELFNALDKDGDGNITLEEFKGTSAQSWAAMHTISTSLPTMNEAFRRAGETFLPVSPPPDAPLYSWIFTWVYYLLL